MHDAAPSFEPVEEPPMAERKYWFYERGQGNSEVRPLTARSLMTPNPETLKPADLVMDAMKLIQENQIRHIPIVSEKDGRLAGLVTQTDILQNVLHGKTMTPDEQYHATLDMLLPLEEIMTKEVYSLGPDAPVTDAIDLLLKKKIRCIPIIDPEGRVSGIVTETDLMALLEHVIER